MTAMPRDVAKRRPAQFVQIQPAQRPARPDRSGQWVIAFVFLGLPLLFIMAFAAAFAAA